MKALVCGAGGFIGSHLVERLKAEGFWVRGIDLKYPEFGETAADDFLIGDLRDPTSASMLLTCLSMRSISWQPTWGGRALFSPANTMQT